MYREKSWVVIFVLASLVLSASNFASAQSTDQDDAEKEVEQSFSTRSADLIHMHQFFQREGSVLVAFNSMSARAQGFSEGSIALAEQLAAFTNDLLEEVASELEPVDVTKAQADVHQYPLLAAYFDEAARRVEQHERGVDDPEIERLVTANSALGEAHCGTFWYPLPPNDATPVFHSSSNPSETLISWGYHATPQDAGGGWTRPQTHDWWICGFNTFRDHAYIGADGSTISEQNYEGWTPRGEPNPEVWASGPWPYPTWPAYVAWWHSRY